jgi:hypothetical protein
MGGKAAGLASGIPEKPEFVAIVDKPLGRIFHYPSENHFHLGTYFNVLFAHTHHLRGEAGPLVKLYYGKHIGDLELKAGRARCHFGERVYFPFAAKLLEHDFALAAALRAELARGKIAGLASLARASGEAVALGYAPPGYC